MVEVKIRIRSIAEKMKARAKEETQRGKVFFEQRFHEEKQRLKKELSLRKGQSRKVNVKVIKTRSRHIVRARVPRQDYSPVRQPRFGVNEDLIFGKKRKRK